MSLDDNESTNPMSSYASVLRNSKLIALPPAIRSAPSDNHFPTRPAIRTTRANQNVGDWGLKRPMPKLRTQNITISGIDTQEHQTPFESSNRHTKVVQRWQELGIPVRKPVESQDLAKVTYDTGAIFDNVNKGINMRTLPRTDADRLIKKARSLHERVVNKQGKGEPVVYSDRALEKALKVASDELGLVEETRQMHTLQANGGLAYHPHGALTLFNTPDGPKERQLLARIINSKGNATFAGLAGIVSAVRDDFQNRSIRPQGRAATVKIYQTRAQFDTQGRLELNLDTKVPETFDRMKRSTDIAYADFLRGFGDSPEGYTEDDMDEISIEKSTSKRLASGFEELLKTSPVYRKPESEE